jgi:hypothetical protein
VRPAVCKLCTATILGLASLAGCQDDITTPFPEGLEPFEDNVVEPRPDGPFDEGLRTETRNNDFIRVYGRGFVRVPFDTLWQAAKAVEPNASVCKTTSHTVMVNNQPQYDFSFLISYVVNDILTVEWDDQWRFGLIEAGFGMIKHQKTQGSDFVALSEGTIQVLATSDPGVSELVFLEHLDAVQASASDVIDGVQHNYTALVATAKSEPIPPCP